MRYLFLVVLLGGCGLNPQYRAEKEAERLAKFEAECERIGYQRGTQAMTDCKLLRLNAYDASMR